MSSSKNGANNNHGDSSRWLEGIHPLCTEADLVLKVFPVLARSILTLTLPRRQVVSSPRFTAEEVETHRGRDPCPRSHSQSSTVMLLIFVISCPGAEGTLGMPARPVLLPLRITAHLLRVLACLLCVICSPALDWTAADIRPEPSFHVLRIGVGSQTEVRPLFT